MTKTLLLILWMVALLDTSIEGVHALLTHTNAGWLTGFVFATSVNQLLRAWGETEEKDPPT